MISFKTQQVTVLRPAYSVDHGTPVPDWSAADQFTVSGCRVQAMVADEQILGRDSVESRWRLDGPAGMDLRPRDRVVWDEKTYEVEGQPLAVASATGGLAHTEALLTLVEG